MTAAINITIASAHNTEVIVFRTRSFGGVVFFIADLADTINPKTSIKAKIKRRDKKV